MELQFADFIILGIAGLSAVFGLFIGFSGALAFLCGSGAAAIAGRLGWAFSVCWLDSTWTRLLATAVFTLVIFGLTRRVTRKIAHGMLAQPADALFGLLVAGASGFGLSVGVAYLLCFSKIYPVQSEILNLILGFLGVR